MLNLTVGPVQMKNTIRKIASEQLPYFRTDEFSEIIFENEKLIKKFCGANEKAKSVFITGSGTASMEATIVSILTKEDRVLVVNSGNFGQRFVELCKIYNVDYDEIRIEYGHAITEVDLMKYDGKKYTAFIVNLHETSTGVLHDINLISNYCKKNNLLLIVDAISSFLADPINMEKESIDVLIIGSQKALACSPGISIVVLSQKAQERVQKNDIKGMYLNLKIALVDSQRGQTPFTPAIGILLQLNLRLKEIEQSGGIEKERIKIKEIAEDFRNKIKKYPFKFFSENMSNACTSLVPLTIKPTKLFEILKNEYCIWICPNGGELKEKIVRIGHIGDLTTVDNDELILALEDIKKRGLL